MLEKVKQRITGIRDEVHELHPLLDELFRRHPDIPHFEYTHGQGEMGADFVLTLTHQVLGSIEYVGVVAKRGKIHQNLDDVERQIWECTNVPRKIDGGKKEVTPSQVWVVATGNITGGAKDKIHAKYPGTNVHFIGNHQLSTMVADYVPSYHVDVDLSVARYLSDTMARSEELDMSYDIVPGGGEPIYIEQDVVHVEIDPYRADRRKKNGGKPKPVVIEQEILTNKLSLLEAGMGGGKSKLLRKLNRHYADVTTFLENKVLPVSATFKELVDGYEGDLRELLAEKVPCEAREAAGQDVEYLFLIDGVDEKEMTPEEFSDMLASITEQVNQEKSYRLVLASRYVGDLDFDRRFLLNLDRYEIAPLSMGKIVRFLNIICRRFNLQTRVIEDLQRSVLFDSLPQHPMAAVLLGQLLAENQQELPSTMTELYQKYMEMALGRWDARKGLQSQAEFETLENVLMDLAKYVVENGLEMITLAEVEDRFREYLKERNLNVEVELLIERAVKRADVLARSSDGHSIWFKHRSFAEFLYAQWLHKHGKLEPSVQAFELYWTNIYFFGLGLQKDAPELLEALIDTPPERESHQWMKMVNLASFLMAAYHTPNRVIQKGVHRAALEAAQLFQDATEGRVPSPLSKLSRMHLLYLLQLLMRDNYGYEFLAPALEEAAGRLLEGDEDAQQRAYATFLVSVAYIDAGGGDSFDWLLEGFEGYLPLDLRLAVWHEGDELNSRNKAIKKLRRQIEGTFKDNPGFREKVKQLHERPVAMLEQRDKPGGSSRAITAGSR